MSIIHGVDALNKVHPLFLGTDGSLEIDPAGLILSGEPLLTDGSGRLIIAASESTFLNPTGLLAQYSNLSLAAGTNSLTTYTVTTGQRVRLTNASFRYTGTVAGVAFTIHVSDGTNAVRIFTQSGLTSNQFYMTTTDVLLESAWTIVATITGATLNDDFIAAYAFQRYK